MAQGWDDLAVRADQSIREVIARIDAGGQKIALVIGTDQMLLGTVSDGDVRRAIIRNVPLSRPARSIMNPSPRTVPQQATREDALAVMRDKRLTLLPVLDEAGRIVGLHRLEDGLILRERPNTVVLMAGGKGLRLRPLTETVPKPLLKVGDKPILEIIIRQLADHGFRRLVISINYLGQMIRDYFGDGSRFGVEIEYVNETQALGTAGGLGLMARCPDEPMIVMNGDVLTRLRYDWLMDHHLSHDACATVAVREYEFQVPFGVVQATDGFVTSIDEKPVQKFFVSAGIYVLDPGLLSQIEPNVSLDMPDFLERMRTGGRSVSAFPMREFWLDIGRPEDLFRAEREFNADDVLEPLS
jgi:dTDP-glucose pyrophosphorylase/predicted transcriptional regulator